MGDREAQLRRRLTRHSRVFVGGAGRHPRRKEVLTVLGRGDASDGRDFVDPGC
jgi:hypothetical protein